MRIFTKCKFYTHTYTKTFSSPGFIPKINDYISTRRHVQKVHSFCWHQDCTIQDNFNSNGVWPLDTYICPHTICPWMLSRQNEWWKTNSLPSRKRVCYLKVNWDPVKTSPISECSGWITECAQFLNYEKNKNIPIEQKENVHNSIILSSPKLATAQMSIKRRMNKL